LSKNTLVEEEQRIEKRDRRRAREGDNAAELTIPVNKGQWRENEIGKKKQKEGKSKYHTWLRSE